MPYVSSKVIDVGLQQGGLDCAAPNVMSEKTYDTIKLLVGNNTLLKASYDTADNNTYQLNDYGKQNIEKLDTLISLPLIFAVSDGWDGTLDAPDNKIKNEYNEFSKTQDQSIIKQRAIAANRAELESCGVDTGKIQMDYLYAMGALMLGLAILIIVVSFGGGLLRNILTMRISRDKRKQFFTKVMNFSSAEINKFSESSLITRSTNDIQLIQNMAGLTMSTFLNAPISIIVGFYFAWITAPMLSWIVILAAVSVLAAACILVKLTAPVFARMQYLFDKVNLITREMLSGIYVSRAFNRAKHDEKRFDNASVPLYKTQLFTGRLMSVINPMLTLGLNGVTVLVFLIGGWNVNYGNLQVGNILAFTSYAATVVAAFTSLGMFIGSLPRATVAVNRIEEVINTDISIKNEKIENPIKIDESYIPTIKFDNVSFSYNNTKTYAIENVDFEIKPGSTFGIIGTVGSGKSTILDLLLRLQDTNQGNIFIDGVNIKNVPLYYYRSLFGYAPQQSFLFSGTVESNINYGITDDSLKKDKEYLKKSIKTAQAENFVFQNNKDGLDREISQDSTNISGGQRQRLSIARALATNCPVLVFDDCFSALDYKVEKNMRQAIRQSAKDKTKVIVTSRLSSILDADQIIVLDEGRMVGRGTHQELLKNCAEYIKIAKSQLDYKEGGDYNEK